MKEAYAISCYLLFFFMACATIPVTGDASKEDKQDITTEDSAGTNLHISNWNTKEISIDGGYNLVENTRSDVIEVFNWLKAQLQNEGISLTGEHPLETYMQVVSGNKYRLLCQYESVESTCEKLLLAGVFFRSDGYREIQEVVLDMK